MSFPVVLQNTGEPINAIEKNPTDILTVTGDLRGGASIIDPAIIFEFPPDVDVDDIVANINYCYIEAFKRWYFVTNIISQTTKLWTLHLHVDVLMTYKAGIREQTGVIARQANNYNLNLDDGWFMSYQNPRHQTKWFSNSAPFETQEFVLVVAGS